METWIGMKESTEKSTRRRWELLRSRRRREVGKMGFC
jgi:hypothetical protein